MNRVGAPTSLKPQRKRPGQLVTGLASRSAPRVVERRLPVHVYVPPRTYAFRWLDLWRYRALVRYFGKFYVKRKYRRALLGWLWVPLRPTYDLLGKTILFGGLLSVSSGDRPYFIFFIVGTSAWRIVQMGLHQSIRALDMNRTLFSRVNVPRATALVAGLVPAVLDVLVYVVIGAAGCLYYKLTQGSFYIVITPKGLTATAVGVALLMLYVMALGLWVAPFAFYARDARYLLNYGIGFWYVITPIIYPISSIPSEKLQKVAEYNPLTAPCQLVQWGLMQTSFPEMISVLVSLATLGVVGAGGLLYFARTEARAAAHV